MDSALHLLSLSILASASLANAWTTYVVPHTAGADDTPALAAAFATGNYSANATILFQKGVTYNIFTPITFPKFNNVEVAIEGNLTYPDSISTIQSGPSVFTWHSISIEPGAQPLLVLRDSADTGSTSPAAPT